MAMSRDQVNIWNGTPVISVNIQGLARPGDEHAYLYLPWHHSLLGHLVPLYSP
jgi:hypothetical protein